MGVAQIQLTGSQRKADGSLLVTWADGSAQEFASLDDVRAFAVIENDVEGQTLAKRLILAKALALDPALANTNLLVGTVCTINPGAPNPVQIG